MTLPGTLHGCSIEVSDHADQVGRWHWSVVFPTGAFMRGQESTEIGALNAAKAVIAEWRREACGEGAV